MRHRDFVMRPERYALLRRAADMQPADRKSTYLSDISTSETKSAYLRSEGFWIIIAIHGAKMRQKTEAPKPSADSALRDIRRVTRKHHSAEDKIRIVLEGLRGEDSIAEICRRAGIVESLYYSWSKEFLEAGKKRLAGDTSRAATTDEVKVLRREARNLKEVVAEQALELRLLKKSMIAAGGQK